MKKVMLLVMSAMFVFGQASAQSDTRDIMKQRAKLENQSRKMTNDAKASKDAKKQAKQYRKEGWNTMPGQLPLEKQVERSFQFQNMFEEDLVTPKYVWGDASSIAQVYDAGKMQALELSRQNLAAAIETQVARLVSDNVSNDQLAQGQATSLVQTLSKAKSKVTAKLGQTVPVVEMYRKLDDGTVEVRTQIFYSMDKAREVVRDALRQQMLEEGQQMSAEVDKLLSK